MNTNTIEFNGRQIKIPQGWNDLNTTQLYMLYFCLFSEAYTFLDAEEITMAMRISATRYLLDLKDEEIIAWRNQRRTEFGATEGNNIFLTELRTIARTATEHLFEETEDEEGRIQVQIRFALTKNPYPWLDFRATTLDPPLLWYAPADSLSNVTIYELGVLFTLFEQYVASKNEGLVDRLLATMYRPPKPQTEENLASNYKGDIRLPYMHYETTVDDRLPLFQRISTTPKQLLLFWFVSCRHTIITQHPKVFKPRSEGDSKDPGYGWGGLLLQLADGLANLESVANQNYGNAFLHLSMLEDQRREAEIQRMRKR